MRLGALPKAWGPYGPCLVQCEVGTWGAGGQKWEAQQASITVTTIGNDKADSSSTHVSQINPHIVRSFWEAGGGGG